MSCCQLSCPLHWTGRAAQGCRLNTAESEQRGQIDPCDKSCCFPIAHLVAPTQRRAHMWPRESPPLEVAVEEDNGITVKSSTYMCIPHLKPGIYCSSPEQEECLREIWRWGDTETPWLGLAALPHGAGCPGRSQALAGQLLWRLYCLHATSAGATAAKHD